MNLKKMHKELEAIKSEMKNRDIQDEFWVIIDPYHNKDHKPYAMHYKSAENNEVETVYFDTMPEAIVWLKKKTVGK